MSCTVATSTISSRRPLHKVEPVNGLLRNCRHGHRLTFGCSTRQSRKFDIQTKLRHTDTFKAPSSLKEATTTRSSGSSSRILQPCITTISLLAASLLALLSHPDPAAAVAQLHQPEFQPVAADISNLASGEDFWENVARYGRFFVSVMVGTAYIMVKPLANLLKRPVTAVLLVAGLVGLYFFLKFSLEGMLGLTEY